MRVEIESEMVQIQQIGGPGAGEPPGSAGSNPGSIVVAVSGAADSAVLVEAGAALAESMCVPWEAIHVETPEASRDPAAALQVAEALALASKRGATIATVAAATAADGILEHLRTAAATHLVIGHGQRVGWRAWRQRSTLDALAARADGIMLHVLPRSAGTAEPIAGAGRRQSQPDSPRNYSYAIALVVATLLVAEVLQLFTGPRSLDLVFLFPVIAVAARLGLRPALLAAALSVFCYNYFLLIPAFSFDIRAPQNLVMSAVLFVIAAYTSILTTRMRGRLFLSDRSARENASLAALAQRLTRDADWKATATTVCEHVHGLLGVQAMMFREVEGMLTPAAAVPPQQGIGPVDRAALDWSWAHGEEAGAGTTVVSAADWQFQPLKTSLGVLAVLALAREDGRDPIGPSQRILLSTIIAQAALAHERLRLEDLMRTADASSGQP